MRKCWGRVFGKSESGLLGSEKLRIFHFLASGFNLGLAINLVIIFFLANTRGEVLVTTNQYNERWIETILFPVFVFMGLISLIIQFRTLRKGTMKGSGKC